MARTITEAAADVLTEEDIYVLWREAEEAWGDLSECWLNPYEALTRLDELRGVNARLEAMRDVILDYASRSGDRRAELHRVASLPPAPEGTDDDG